MFVRPTFIVSHSGFLLMLLLSMSRTCPVFQIGSRMIWPTIDVVSAFRKMFVTSRMLLSVGILTTLLNEHIILNFQKKVKSNDTKAVRV